MHRVKKVAYEEEDLYSDDDYYDGGEEGGASTEDYTAEDRDNFATLTPVVRAELDEAGVQDVSSSQIEDALWNYYWDVGKSVAYLKNARTPRPAQTQQPKTAKKDSGIGNRFDEAAKKNAGKSDISLNGLRSGETLQGSREGGKDRVAGLHPPISAAEWFKDTPWTQVPEEMLGILVPAEPLRPQPKLLGGSSKLAKLAEERRKRAAASQTTPSAQDGAINSLDRLSRPQAEKENVVPVPNPEPKKYAIRKRREPTPPPREPTPPPEEPEEQLPDLRCSPTEFGRTLSASPRSVGNFKRMTLEDLLGSPQGPDAFNEPSPDDAIIRNAKAAIAANSLAKKTEALKIDPASATPPQPKVRSKGLDVPKLWGEAKSTRSPSAAFVVIGHVDHGKSTLMGRLLLDTGAVAQRDIDKYKKQAAELGKASFALAWVMDVGSDEREHGITIDFAHHHFKSNNINFSILDAPGHRDFVPNMIAGASMADFAVLVVDANQIESGMKGQTREHILLAYATGIRRIVVAINKLDSTNPPWSSDVYHTVAVEVTKALTQTGFVEENIALVPCSGLSGDNVVRPPSQSPDAQWATAHPSLLHHLEQSLPSPVEPKLVSAPLRLPIAYVDRTDSTNALTATGRIRAGSLQIGDGLLVQPTGETATVRGIEVDGEEVEWAVAGQICTLRLVDIEKEHVRGGDVLCGAASPARAVTAFTARVRALDGLLPEPVSLHVGRLDKPAWIRGLVATLDEGGEVLKKKPRVVKKGQVAVVRVGVEEGLVVEVGERIVLRSRGETMATGVVREVLTAG